MPIEKIVDSLDGVDEALHGFYTQGEDGKFHLEDVTALRNSMKHAKTERDEARRKAASVAKWEKLGKSPDEIQALLEAQAAKEEEAARKAGDFDSILNQHKTAWEGEKSQLTGQVDFWQNKYKNAELSYALTSELSKAEVTTEGLEVLPRILKERVKFEVEGDKVHIKILAADGATPMAGGGADGQATFADLVKDAKTKYPSLFKGSGQGGSGASDTGGSGGNPPTNLKRSQMTVTEKSKYIADHGQEAYLKLPM
jgi:DNA-binding transcriptional MerR regulator